MTVRRILRIGEPELRQVAAPIEAFDTAELHSLIADMLETMHAADGAGLAATQFGVARRVMVFGVEATARYPDIPPIPETVLINPTFHVVGNETIGNWEGCLSVPGLRGYVTRPARIHYSGCDAFGTRVVRDVDGFHAAVFQHEYDHLDGILFPDRIADRTKFGFEPELRRAGLI